ncbi:MAG: zf-HC2 domain-containing protein [Thermodesulfobacteriota bacterium]
MRCAEIRKLISLYIDDRLSPDEKEALSSHTRNCSGCQEALEEARAVHELFASAERFSAPYGFTTRVLANLETESLSPWWAIFTRRPLILRVMELGFALIVVVSGLHFGNLLVPERVPPQRPMSVQESFSLDLFQATPPDSISGAYVALAEASHEK